MSDQITELEVPINQESKTARAPLTPEEGILDARNFFASMGIPVGDDSLASQELTKEQLQKLEAWREESSKEGVEMPTEQDFYRKVFLAASLWRQKEGDKINYLFGKGVGVEIALRGTVKNRKKKEITLSYRTHSDFDLYGVDYPLGPGGYSNVGKSPYSEQFLRVFGAQEYFHPTATKGLSLPPTLLHDTYETVDLGGIEFLIPQLEILFLDKWLRSGVYSRPEGPDAELLAKQYSLDKAKVDMYLDRFARYPKEIDLPQEHQKLNTMFSSNINL